NRGTTWRPCDTSSHGRPWMMSDKNALLSSLPSIELMKRSGSEMTRSCPLPIGQDAMTGYAIVFSFGLKVWSPFISSQPYLEEDAMMSAEPLTFNAEGWFSTSRVTLFA